MKRFLSIISLFFLAAAPAAAQEYDSPEYVSLGRELPRGKSSRIPPPRRRKRWERGPSHRNICVP